MKHQRLLTSKKIAIFLCVAVLGFSSCSSDPSTTGRKILEERVAKGSDGKLKVTDFKKINGLSGEHSGIKFYKLQYQAEIEFQEAGWKSESGIDEAFTGPSFEVHSEQPGGWDAMMTSYKHHEKGEKMKMKGTMNLIKTENGWQNSN